MSDLSRIQPLDDLSCCGCLSCEAVCPRNAISMTVNKKGFVVPIIDDDKCINCGQCLKVCDFKKNQITDSNIERAFSFVVKDKRVLKNSTSGGAFSAMSNVVLAHSGCIIGAIMDEFTVHHVVAEDMTLRDKMRGSKYVQSNTEGIWEQVRKILTQGKEVLFTGTPCQCAALRSFLGKEYDNLTVVDFLCHGVPNNRMFKEHVEYLSRHFGASVVGFSFRNKVFGWDSYNNIVYLSNGKAKSRWINQIYYSFFSRNLSLRPSCHQCPYRSLHRPSDITIADFWGIEKLTGRKNQEGVSLVLTHSEKGLSLVKNAKIESHVREYPMESVLFRIQTSPSKPNARCDSFWKTYLEQGYAGIVREFFNDSIGSKIRFEIRKVAKKMNLA